MTLCCWIWSSGSAPKAMAVVEFGKAVYEIAWDFGKPQVERSGILTAHLGSESVVWQVDDDGWDEQPLSGARVPCGPALRVDKVLLGMDCKNHISVKAVAPIVAPAIDFEIKVNGFRRFSLRPRTD